MTKHNCQPAYCKRNFKSPTYIRMQLHSTNPRWGFRPMMMWRQESSNLIYKPWPTNKDHSHLLNSSRSKTHYNINTEPLCDFRGASVNSNGKHTRHGKFQPILCSVWQIFLQHGNKIICYLGQQLQDRQLLYPYCNNQRCGHNGHRTFG